MGILEDISNTIGHYSGADEAQSKIQRVMDLHRQAAVQGYPLGAEDPRWRRENPELAQEFDDINNSMAIAAAGGGGGVLNVGSRAALPAGRGILDNIIEGARDLGIPLPGGQRAFPPRSPAVAGEVIPPLPNGAPAPTGGRPTITDLGPGGTALPPGSPPGGPAAVPGSSNLPGVASSAAGSGAAAGRPTYTTVGGGTPPTPPGGGGAPPVSPGAAPTPPSPGGSGILGSIWNTIKVHPEIAIGGLIAGGTGLAAAGAQVANAGRPGNPNYQPAGEMDMRPGADIAAEMERERKAKQDAEDARNRRIRGANAETSLTEAQAAYYQAQREKALQELANSDLTDSEKLEVAHQYALEAAREKAKLEMDQEMVRQGGENERTGIREQGQDRRTAFQGGVEMRGQDQRAREAQDRFVVDWMQNQIQRGQLSLERATKLFEAYQKQQKLPAEILKSVSDSISPFLPYMTNRSAGEAAPGFGEGGTMAKLAKMAGAKFNPSEFKATSDFNLFNIAAQYGGGPGQAQPMPTVDQVFQGAGQAPDINEENAARVRGMSQSSAPLSRPAFGDTSSFSDPMPDDAMERVMGGIR